MIAYFLKVLVIELIIGLALVAAAPDALENNWVKVGAMLVVPLALAAII